MNLPSSPRDSSPTYFSGRTAGNGSGLRLFAWHAARMGKRVVGVTTATTIRAPAGIGLLVAKDIELRALLVNVAAFVLLGHAPPSDRVYHACQRRRGEPDTGEVVRNRTTLRRTARPKRSFRAFKGLPPLSRRQGSFQCILHRPRQRQDV